MASRDGDSALLNHPLKAVLKVNFHLKFFHQYLNRTGDSTLLARMLVYVTWHIR